jgi:hypothetical protein
MFPAAVDDTPVLQRVCHCRRLVERQRQRRTLPGRAKQEPPRPVFRAFQRALTTPFDHDRSRVCGLRRCRKASRSHHEVGLVSRCVDDFDPGRRKASLPIVQSAEHNRAVHPVREDEARVDTMEAHPNTSS